jgi:hypothetical protein
MDHYISMYIDNELSLDEKILFLEHVFADKPYKDDAVSLLEQEKILHAALTRTAPAVELKTGHAVILPFLSRSMGWAVAASLALLISFMSSDDFNSFTATQPEALPAAALHRFVIHHQDTSQVEITGSFTNWRPIPLAPAGTNDYWEIYLELPVGEHRYSFIIDGAQYLPDPTVPAQEADDFGSTNSILQIEV